MFNCSKLINISSILVNTINFDKHISKKHAQSHIDFAKNCVTSVNTRHPNELRWYFQKKYSRYNI